jgi:hemerythrin-like domain-containing protein
MEPSIAHGYASGHEARKPTEILSDEHRVIERVLDAVEKLAKGPVGALEPWKKALDFIRGFADQCHHFKEEKVLFPAMEAHGIPSEGGPIGMMLMEHEEGRSYVRAMLAAISLIEAKNEAAQESLLSSAQAYCRLLREHIQKEDDVLFHMADEVISPDEQRKLSAAFAQHEAEEMGAGVHEKYLKIATELEGAAG